MSNISSQDLDFLSSFGGSTADASPSGSTSSASRSTAGSSATNRVTSFVQEYLPVAERVAERTGVEPHVILGQWGLETGWGRSVIPGTNNLGNIKDFSGAGPKAKDNMTGSVDAYRKYDSADSFAEDFSGLLQRRYKNSLGYGDNAAGYFSALKAGGYAEDPGYVSKGVSAARMAREAMGSVTSQPAQQSQPAYNLAARPDDLTGRSKQEEPSAMDGIKDTAIAFGAGVVRGGGMIANAFGADNPVARGANEIADSMMDGQSDQRKAERASRAELIRQAEESGSKWEEIKANIVGFLEAPIETSLGAIGTSAPTILMSFIPGLGQANAARLILQGAVGAAQGAGAVKGSIYESVERKLIEDGADPDTAAKVAAGAQAYDSANGGQIALGAILGVAAGTTGIERSVSGILGNTLKSGKQPGVLGRIALGVAKESPVEGVQGGQERYAANQALINEGFQIDPWQGVTGQAAGEAVASAGPGGLFGALDNSAPVARSNNPQGGDTGPLTDAISPELNPSGSGQAATMDPPGAEQPADPIAKRASEIEQAVRDDGLLEQLRQIGQPGRTAGEFLDALAVAKNPKADPRLRQQAIESLEMAMGWLQDGKMPGAEASGQPFRTDLSVPPVPRQPGTDLATQGDREVAPNGMGQFFDPNTVDVDAVRVDNMIGGPRAIDGPRDAIGMDPTLRNQRTETKADPAAEPAAEAGAQVASEGTIVVDADADLRARNEQEAQQKSRRKVEMPKVEIPAGTEPAAFRKANAQIQAAIDNGFDVVERRADGQFLVNPATNQEISLSLGDMARARKIISDTINRRANEAASSPLNDLERPTEAQAKAGNYKKGAAKLNGLSIAIENPRGSTRSGTSPDGRKWENTMAHHYGYLKRTEGADGDQVDVFIGPRPDLDTVFVVDQINPRTGRFDEHKVMMGFPDAESARQGYMANYDADWQGFGAITPMSLDQFRKWVRSDAAKLPAASYDPAIATKGDGDGREGSGDRGAAVDSRVDSDSGREGENDGGIAGGRSSGARQLEDAAESQGSGERASAQPDSPDRSGARDRRSVEEILEEARQRVNPNIRAADPNSSDTKALNALLDIFARLTGKRAIAISMTGKGAFDGVQFGDVNLINVDRPEVHVATTIAHEFKHLTEHIPSFARVYERIWEMIPESGRREFYESYLARTRDDVPPFFDMATPQAITILKQEMVADFIGKRFNDREWLNQLAAKKPALFGDFVRDWVRVLDEIAQRLKALMGLGGTTEQLKNVDRYIADLEQAKALAMEAVEMWATKYPRIARERGYVGGEVMFSARDDDFTGMDDFDGFNLDGDFMDGEMERMLQEELAAEMEGANASPTADAIDPKELKAAGIMAERAFGDLYWEDESGDGWQLTARVPDLYTEGKTARLEIEQNVDGLWRADLTGTWVGPAAAENSGYATEQGVKDFVARHVASVALARSGFDLISAAPKTQVDRATKAWKQLGGLEFGGKSKAFKFGRAGRQAQTLKEIAEGMGILDNYNLSVFVDQMDPTSMIYNMTFTHKESSKSYSAMLELHKVGDKKFFTANTIELGRSGMGAAVYQMAADFAARRGTPLRPESSLSGVNTYRRTEQMISAALRTGKSNAMVPHPTQRIYGFNDKATTEADHTKNIGRLLLASLRNVRELAPEVEELLYFPESDTFTFLDGEDAKVLVDEILSRTDARAFGLGRTQLARAAMTQQFMQGEKAPAVDDLSASVLYSARIKDEVEYQAVVDKYKGTDQWLKAPNGLATKLTERQWVQVRTPSFKQWFGDWEKFATMEGGVWNDASDEVSKAVDQQTGEPLVLYHGTTKGGFFRFNGATGTRRGELGTFATPNYEMAASYVRRGRPQDIPMPTNRADLEEIGYQFEEGEDGRIDLIGLDGYVDDTFDTIDEAVDHAIKTFQGSDDTPTIYALFANVRSVGEEDFKGAMWTGDFEGDKFEVYDSNGDIAYTEDGRDVMDRDEAVALAERVGGSFEPASPLPFNTDDVARDALLNKQDGAIIRNVIDDGGGAGGYYGEPSDVFVIFSGANVKSAEFNSGEFDDSEDIRYSAREPAVGDKTDISKLPVGVTIPSSVAVGSLEKSFELASGKTFARGRDLKIELQNAVRRAAKEAGVDLEARTQSTHRFLADMVEADARYALQSNANAVGWYDSKVSRAIGALAQIHPEIETDPEARLAFLWALAVTSNGVKVDKNFALAESAYRTWRATGRMPSNIGIGNAAAAINKGLQLHQTMVEKLGAERLMKFMSTELPAGQIARMFGIKPNGEWTNTPVRGASILGPKIGNGFFSNLNGYFSSLTMDRWLMRTWGRMTGTLMQVDAADVGAKQRDLITRVNELTDAERREMADLIGVPVRKNMTRAQADQVAIAAQKASMKTDKRAVMMANDRLNEFRKKANNLQRALDGQKEAPANPGERNWIRAVFDAALAKLQAGGLRMTMSDLQALLWYPERRLYDAAKSDEDVAEGYEDDEAPDYANAALKLAIDAGKDPIQVLKAMDAAERRGTAKGEPMTAAEIEAMNKEFRAAPKQQVQMAFEVAPDPADKALVAQWIALPEKDRRRITESVYKDVIPRITEMAGVQLKKIVSATGGFDGFVNPNALAEYNQKDLSIDQARATAALIGYVLDQDSVALVDPRAEYENGLIRVAFSGSVDSRINEIFEAIRQEVPEVDAFTLRGRNLDILNFTRMPDEELATRIEEALQGFDADDITYQLSHGKSRSELIEKDSYEGHILGLRPGSGQEIRAGADWLRDRARQAVAEGIAAAQARDAAGAGRAAAARVGERVDERSARGAGRADVKLSARLPGELFYSELKRQIDGASMKQAAPGAWKQFIKALSGKGVKADEIEWTGVTEWLDLQEGKITRQQISDYLGANGVQVQEVVLGKMEPLTDRQRLNVAYERAIDAADAAGGSTNPSYIERQPPENRTPEEQAVLDAWNAVNENPEESWAPEGVPSKYGQYTLPGGQNYREVLLTLPSLDKDLAWARQREEEYGKNIMNWPDEVLEELDRRQGAKSAAKTEYKSSHWETPNVLAHIRLNDRIDSEGRKVLFVEELQSDFQQDYRKAKQQVKAAVEADFTGIVERMKKAGLLQVDCD